MAKPYVSAEDFTKYRDLFIKHKRIIGVVLLVFLASVPSFYYFRQYQKAQYKLNNPTEVAKQEAKKTIEAVRRLLLLPQGEEPTVMQVTDVSKLKDQAFFANAQNGDKVIIYVNAKKAILYRSQTNKIIDVVPINLGNTATPSSTASVEQIPLQSPSPTPMIKPTTTSPTIKK